MESIRWNIAEAYMDTDITCGVVRSSTEKEPVTNRSGIVFQSIMNARRGPDIPRVAGCVPEVSEQLVHTGRQVVSSGVTWQDGT